MHKNNNLKRKARIGEIATRFNAYWPYLMS